MSSQPKEWDEMSETQQQEIKARLDAIVTGHAHVVAETPAVKARLLRARLSGGWRTDLGKRLGR